MREYRLPKVLDCKTCTSENIGLITVEEVACHVKGVGVVHWFDCLNCLLQWSGSIKSRDNRIFSLCSARHRKMFVAPIMIQLNFGLLRLPLWGLRPHNRVQVCIMFHPFTTPPGIRYPKPVQKPNYTSNKYWHRPNQPSLHARPFYPPSHSIFDVLARATICGMFIKPFKLNFTREALALPSNPITFGASLTEPLEGSTPLINQSQTNLHRSEHCAH